MSSNTRPLMRIAWCLLLTFAGNSAAAQGTADLSVGVVDLRGETVFNAWPQETSHGGFLNTVSVAIRNGGAATAGAFTVGLYLSLDSTIDASDFRLATTSHTGLSAGAAVSWRPGEQTIPQRIPPEIYFVGVLVDDMQTVAESNEDNNQVVTNATIEIHGPTSADLVPGPVLLVIGNRTTGSTAHAIAAPEAEVSLFSWSVTNRGIADASAFSLGFFISTDDQITRTDRRIGTRHLSGLVAGDVHTTVPREFGFTIPQDLTAGLYYVGVLVDPEQQVAEAVAGREGNNGGAASLQIVEAPTDRTDVWRVQIRLTTASRENADTDDYVYVSLGPNHRTWLDHGHNDFEEGDAYTYDLLLDGISSFADIQYIEIGKEGTDGWCVSRVQLLVNERTMLESAIEPCGWIDPPQSAEPVRFTYRDLRLAQQWRDYDFSMPSLISPSDLENMIQTAMGHGMKEQAVNGYNTYWGGLSGDAVEVSYASSDSVHINIEFMAEVLGPDPEIELDFNLGIGCSCGEVAFAVSGLETEVSSLWYPGPLKDYVERTILNSISQRVEEFTPRSSRVPLCPVISIHSNGGIRFDIPAFNQDLELQTDLSPTTVRPGEPVTLRYRVANIGNQRSGPFNIDVYLFTATDARAQLDPESMISLGTRIAGSANRSAIGVCTNVATWEESVVLPAAMECSDIRAAFVPPRLPSRSSAIQPMVRGRAYWFVANLTGVREPAGDNNVSIAPLIVSRADLALQLNTPGVQVFSGRRLSLSDGRVTNLGAYGSDRLRYRVTLGGSVLLEGEHDGLPRGATMTWPGATINMPARIPAGKHPVTIDVAQITGALECDLTNNRLVYEVEVP